MAIVQNKATEIGDVIVIRAEVPIVGLITLTDFIDTTEGEISDRTFLKEFRYTIDGINYSDWEELTVPNLEAVSASPTDTFILEYRYTRQGANASGELAYVDSTLSGEWEQKPCGLVYQASIFSQFFGCTDNEVLDWCINVTNKLYKKGIVPNFITRGEYDNENNTDADYINFWRTVSCFFAYMVVYARKISQFQDNQEQLFEFLTQRGLYICPSSDLSTLQGIMIDFYQTMSVRGTSKIYKKSEGYRGELLRLLCYNEELDEMIFNLTVNNNLNNWGGLTGFLDNQSLQQGGLVKGYEVTEGFADLDNYPLITPLSIGLDEGVMEIACSGTPTGIGGTTKSIVINPELSYEVIFEVQVPNTSVAMTLGIRATDDLGNVQDLKRSSTNAIGNTFISGYNFPQANKWYTVRAVILPYDILNIPVSEDVLNIGEGNKLMFFYFNRRIIPQLTFTGTGTVLIRDFKVQLTDQVFNPSGYVQTINIITALLTKRNDVYSNQEAENIIRKYFIPYNSDLNVRWLTPVEGLPTIIIPDPIINLTGTAPEEFTQLLLEWDNQGIYDSIRIEYEICPPTGLSGTGGPTNVLLDWTNPGSYDDVEVEFGLFSGIYTDSSLVGSGGEEFDVTSLSGGTTYYFRIRGIRDGMNSDWTEEISATTTS